MNEDQRTTMQDAERRRCQRQPFLAEGKIIHPQGALAVDDIPFWLKNLSVGGALIYGSELHRLKQQHVKMVIHFPWHPPIKVKARVVYSRKSPEGSTLIGVAFMYIKRSAQRLIKEELTAVNSDSAHPRRPSTLIITDQRETISFLQRDLAMLRCEAVFVETPLDAIQWLQDWELRIETIVVDLEHEQSNAMMLLKFFSEEYPQIRRVVICDHEMELLKNVAMAFGKTPWSIDKPWNLETLERVLTFSEQALMPVSSPYVSALGPNPSLTLN
jgi:CheY-like chemotaxis protein